MVATGLGGWMTKDTKPQKRQCNPELGCPECPPPPGYITRGEALAKLKTIEAILNASSYAKLEELGRKHWPYLLVSHTPNEQESEAWYFKNFMESQLFTEGPDHDADIYRQIRLDLIESAVKGEFKL